MRLQSAAVRRQINGACCSLEAPDVLYLYLRECCLL